MSVPRRSLVLGGARSGKSRHAEALVRQVATRPVYIATAEARDREMADRIALHRAQRGPGWQTVEAALALPEALGESSRSGDAVLVDCLTVWLSNLMLAAADVEAQTRDLLAALAASPVPVMLVSNEVGLAALPDNALARDFARLAGRLNRQVAAAADAVSFVVAGQPLRLK